MLKKDDGFRHHPFYSGSIMNVPAILCRCFSHNIPEGLHEMVFIGKTYRKSNFFDTVGGGFQQLTAVDNPDLNDIMLDGTVVGIPEELT